MFVLRVSALILGQSRSSQSLDQQSNRHEMNMAKIGVIKGRLKPNKVAVYTNWAVVDPVEAKKSPSKFENCSKYEVIKNCDFFGFEIKNVNI